MKLINERTLIRGVAEAWEQQYWAPPSPKITACSEILKKLRNLDKEKATAEEVALIIGNDSWASEKAIPKCSECGENVSEIVQVGEEPDYESNTSWICKKCLVRALELFGDNNG